MSALFLIRRPNQDRLALIALYTPLARRVANSWGNTFEQREESIAECNCKLVHLVSESQGITSEAWISTSLRRHLCDLHRRSAAGSRIPASKLISLDQPVGDDTEDDLTLGDLIPDESPTPEDAAISSIWVDEMLNLLPVRQRRVLTGRFGLGNTEPMPIGHVAKVLGIGRTAAYQDMSDALDTLRLVA